MISSQRTRFWKHSDVPELLLLRASYSNQAFPRHTHAEYVIGVNADGAHTFTCRGALHEIPRGTIAFVNPEDVHTGETRGVRGWEYCGFYVEPALMQRLWAEMGKRGDRPPAFYKSSAPDPECALELVKLHDLLSAAEDSLAVTSRVTAVFTRVLLRHADDAMAVIPESKGGAISLAVRQTREYLDENFSKRITLRQLGENAGVGEFRLLRLFLSNVGMPPYEYLTAVRVRHAKRLLAQGKPATSVAFEVGFSDQSHLIRHFKRIVGVTPGVFARGVR
jgi:AraC-like DNA-binding protein